MGRRFTVSLTTTFLAGSAAVAGPAMAQPAIAQKATIENIEVRGQALETYGIDEINSATRLGLSVLETPQSVSAITRTQLDDFDLDSLNDALQSAVGVQVESVETDRTYYTSRGFDITNFQVDGVGVPLTYGNVEGDVDTAIFERIEVIRGANGLMAGAGNPSATINVVRKRPTEDFELSVSGSAGSWNKGRLEADVSGAIAGGVRGRLVAAAEERDSYLDNYAMDKSVVYGVVDRDFGDATRLTVGTTYQESKADSPLWGALPLYYVDGTATDYDVSTSTAADWAYWDSVETNAFAELSHEIARGWTAKAYYSRTTIEGDSELFYMYTDPDGLDPVTNVGLMGWASEYVSEDSRELLDLYVTGNFRLAGREHDLVVGANWMEVTLEDRSLYDYATGAGFPDIGDFSRWTGNTPRPIFADGLTGSDFTDEQVGLYAAARLKLSEGLSLVTGARVIDWQSEGESYGESQETEANGKTLPYAGLTYVFADNYSVYGSYTETFMPQSDIGEQRTRLAPAEGSNRELGVKGQFFDGRLTSSLALFEAKHENVSEYAGFDPEFGSFYEGRDYESEGVEIEVVGELATGLQASVGYTNLSIDDAQGEEARMFVPKQVFRLYTSYRLPMLDQLKLGAGLNWQDDIHRDEGNGIIIEQDSYALIRAFASYQVTDNLNLALSIENLTDEKYINSLYWEQGFYGTPRNLTVSVEWNQ